jgi:hypothetical protein
VAHIYNLRDVALFIEEENLVQAENFHNEYFASKFVYLSDIFEKFNTLNLSMQSMQENDTNIIIVTEKVKAFVGKLGLWVRKLEAESLEIFSQLKDFVEENSVEKSDTGIVQCIKDHLVNLQSRFPKYFPEAVSDKYKWIMDPFPADSPQNYDFSLLKKETILTYI